MIERMRNRKKTEMNSMKRVQCSILSLFLLALAFPAAAQNDTEARVHFDSGALYYEEARYAEAVEEFRRAFELSERIGLLFNMSQCYERMGDLDNAVVHLERYIAGSEESATRAVQERRLTNLRATRDAAQARAEAAAAEVAAAERAAAQRSAAEAARPEATGESRQAPGETSTTMRRLSIALLGVGGAGLVTFGVAGGLALSEDRRLAEDCIDQFGNPSCAAGADTALNRRSLIADIGLGVGIAGAAAGLVLLLMNRSSGDETNHVQIAPSLDTHSGGVTLQGAF